MTTTQLRKFNSRLLHLMLGFEKSAKADGDRDLQSQVERLNDVWQALYKLEQRRRLADARRADRLTILWEIFAPRDSSGWFRQKVITRTPNRVLETSEFSADVHERVVSPEDAIKHFTQAMPPVDTHFMLERQRLVESKPRHYWDWSPAAPSNLPETYATRNQPAKAKFTPLLWRP